MVSTLVRRTEFARQSWRADPDIPPVIMRVVRGWLVSLAGEPAAVARLEVAAGEAVVNACVHAYLPGECGEVQVTLWTDAQVVHLEVIDHGSWRASIDDCAGRGMQAMAGLDQAVLIRVGRRGTQVLLRQHLGGHPEPPPSMPRQRACRRSRG